MEEDQICHIIEAALLASDGPLTVTNILRLFSEDELDDEGAAKQIREALKKLEDQSSNRGVELKRVASGYRYQVRQDLSPWVSRLWDEKPPRYTRALLETLALVAYKQPVTRGDIEQVRGVSVSQSIMRTLVERDWIRIVGQREVPGHPALYGTTKAFLDYFNLLTLDELPPMAEIRALIEPTLVEEEVTVKLADTPPLAQNADGDVMSVEGDVTVSEAGEVIAAHVDLVELEEDTSNTDGTNPVSVEDSADEESSSAEVVQLHTNAQPNA